MEPPGGVRNRPGVGGCFLTCPWTPTLPFKLNQQRRHRILRQKHKAACCMDSGSGSDVRVDVQHGSPLS